jgi:hypothetical protein
VTNVRNAVQHLRCLSCRPPADQWFAEHNISNKRHLQDSFSPTRTLVIRIIRLSKFPLPRTGLSLFVSHSVCAFKLISLQSVSLR